MGDGKATLMDGDDMTWDANEVNNFNEYQRAALETAFFPEKLKLEYLTIALAGEAGEISEKVKKIIRDKGGEITEADRLALALELGDLMWYVAVFARLICDTSLADVAAGNLAKLQSRQQRGTLTGNGDNR